WTDKAHPFWSRSKGVQIHAHVVVNLLSSLASQTPGGSSSTPRLPPLLGRGKRLDDRDADHLARLAAHRGARAACHGHPAPPGPIHRAGPIRPLHLGPRRVGGSPKAQANPHPGECRPWHPDRTCAIAGAPGPLATSAVGCNRMWRWAIYCALRRDLVIICAE